MNLLLIRSGSRKIDRGVFLASNEWLASLDVASYVNGGVRGEATSRPIDLLVLRAACT